MEELARASRGVPRVELLPPATDDGSQRPITTDDWPAPVTTPPRIPTRDPTRLERLWGFVKRHRSAVAGGMAVAITLTLVYIITRPTFAEAYDPPLLSNEARPFPVQPDAVIEAVFAIFGPVGPSVNPDRSSLARYDFGAGTTVDAFNSAVYAITLTTVDRSWQGNRVGLAEQQSRGRLALLGEVRDSAGPVPSPFPIGAYLAYSSAADRPRRRLVTAVRPPNGCFDVQVDLAPRVIGRVDRDEDSFVAVARRGDAMEWVSVRVRVVNRSLAGPYAGPPACEGTP